uniref:Quinidine resistance protein 1 n=1 Tax=Talaromyces marneffei PM1 TaxID=1077442 RepID=A0A093XV19_TALMA
MRSFSSTLKASQICASEEPFLNSPKGVISLANGESGATSRWLGLNESVENTIPSDFGDMTTRAERGGYMWIFQADLLVPVAIGPVIGGAIAGSLGWKAIFWFLTIYSGVFLCLLIFLLPETLRSIVKNGSQLPSNLLMRYPLKVYQKTSKVEWQKATVGDQSAPKKHVDVIGPLRILLSNHAAPTIIFLAVYCAVWQMSTTAMSSLFKTRYGLTEIQIGLTFIANGVGSMVGTLITGKILDKDYRRVKAKYESSLDSERGESRQEEDFPLEKARLRLVPTFSLLQCLSILLFGWTIQYPHKVHIAVPIVSTFITGWTAVSTQSLIMSYLVDIFHDRSAAAGASLNLARCLFAAGGTSFVMPMINGVGVGVAFTICAAVQVVALVGPLVQYKFATGWRREENRDSFPLHRSEKEDVLGLGHILSKPYDKNIVNYRTLTLLTAGALCLFPHLPGAFCQVPLLFTIWMFHYRCHSRLKLKLHVYRRRTPVKACSTGLRAMPPKKSQDALVNGLFVRIVSVWASIEETHG